MMNANQSDSNRRGFLTRTGVGIAAASAAMAAATRPLTEKEKLARIASNTYPLQGVFKSRASVPNPAAAEALKKKYGEITMLDFPQFTRDIFPGVHHMDLWSALFGD